MNLRIPGIVLALTAGGLLVSGCATEAYVDEHVAVLNSRIDSVNNDLGGRIQSVSNRVDQVGTTADQGLQRANAAYRLAEGQLMHTVISESDTVLFATNKWKLSSEAQATLSAFAERLKADNKNVFVEIVGNGDPRGSVYANRILGEKRALEVRRFLSAQGVPLSHMSTVSWGEERSTATGSSPADLASDRRVVLRVLS